MRVRVRTAGTLGRYLPGDARSNAAELEFAAPVTPNGVLRHLGFPLEDRYLVSLNGSAVPTARRDAVTLADGDELAILPPLRGG